MKNLKSLLLALIALLCSTIASAYSFHVNGIYYNIKSSSELTVEVTYLSTDSNNPYNGDVVIPAKVDYNGKTYSVISIGESAFWYCHNLKSVIIPEGVTSIGITAFSYCSGLTSLIIPKSVTSIGIAAFYGCSSLTNISIPEGVSSIEEDAFNGCSGLTSIILPESVTSIGNGAFKECREVVIKSNTPPMVESSSIASEYTVFVVPTIAHENYVSASYWKELAITTEELYIQTLEIKAADNKSSLHATLGDEKLKYVVNLTLNGTINSYDFMIMRNKMPLLRTLDLKDVSIVYNAYEHYTGYHTEDNKFPSYGLYNCKLFSLVFPKNITVVGSNAVSNNRNLKEIVLHPGLETIGSYAFSSSQLTSVIIPEGVVLIGNDAFRNCTCLASITFPKSLESIGMQAFLECDGLTSITIPNGLESIGTNAFYSCSNLEQIVLPPTLKSIGNTAFVYCSKLKEIRIPSSVRTISDNAFKDCSNLNDVYVYTVEPISIGQNTFVKTGNNFIGTLHAPKVSYWDYYYDTQWSQFVEFAEFDEPYDNFYVEGDKEFNDNTGSVGGTPDVEMGDNSGIIVDSDTIKQEMGDVDIEHNGSHGGSIIVNGNGHIHAGKLHFHIHIKAGKWYFFCFPFDIKKKDIFCQGGADWIFRYYDGEERANNGKGGWKNVTSDGNGNHLKAAVGYIFQASKDDILELIVDEKDFKKEDKYNELVAHVTSNAHDASWNFVGNPYLSYYEITRDDYSAPITVWDGSKYKAIRPGDDDYILNPFEAFFVQKPEDDSQVSYNSDNQLTYLQSQTAAANARARRREQAIDPDRLLVNISLTDGEETDQTRVVFNNNAAMDYEAACDAAKFSTAGVPQLYTIDSRAVRYAINERPVAEGIVTMGYSVPVQGNYILSAPRMDTPIAVKDNLTGTVHHFAEGNYVFASEAGTFDDRFTVLMESATGIDNAELGKEKSEMYNIKGQRVENANEQGIYIKDSRKVVKL